MPDGSVNGYPHVAAASQKADRDRLFARVESALAQMAGALMESGFTEYEAGQINLATRFAITGLVKDRSRRN